MNISTFQMEPLGLVEVLQDALRHKDEAVTNLGFLFINASIASLSGNPDFTASLHCSLETAASDPRNISCVEGCSKPEIIFSNWSNFYTCSWYPSLSAYLDRLDTNASTIDAFSSMGIQPNQSSLSQSVSSDIASCLSEYCESSDDCQKSDLISQSCSMENLITTTGTVTTLNRTNAVICLRDNVCSSTGVVNPDIGGLGVIMSLLVQYTLSLSAIICHFLFYIRYQLFRKWWLRKAKGAQRSESLSSAKRILARHLEALTSALVEFQKAQCFFSATLQIAAIIILPQYEYEENSKDQILLRLISANAFAPIVLTLSHIDLLGGRNSKYLLVLALVTFSLGSTTYWLSSPIWARGRNFYRYKAPMLPLMSCSNIAPFAPCYLRNQSFLFKLWTGDSGIFYTQPRKIGLAVWIVTLLLLIHKIVFIIGTLGIKPLPPLQRRFDQVTISFANTRDRLPSFSYVRKILGYFNALSLAITTKRQNQKVSVFMGKRRTWVYAQIIVGVMAVVMQLVSVIQVVLFSSNIISTKMSCGQIVAVGIWVPVLLEYGYLEIIGAAKCTEYRLQFPLVVTRETFGATSGTHELGSGREGSKSFDEDEKLEW
ncbi:uncharacterized protein RSE6_06706 [Rhynchosporium secalis]|uniref:Uncharacterized protein n=1 Tax=Rhynchosporium secalis TaxID=38038 RepID=A0A1E1MB34_RHYSE|nr:uncharacterized protein RSE6_06706 [Rhynchosporium secalis]